MHSACYAAGIALLVAGGGGIVYGQKLTGFDSSKLKYTESMKKLLQMVLILISVSNC